MESVMVHKEGGSAVGPGWCFWYKALVGAYEVALVMALVWIFVRWLWIC